MAGAIRELSNYERLLKFRMDASFNLPSDRKYVWFQPDPKEETYVNAEVTSGELDDMQISIKTADGATGTYKNGLQVFPRNPIKFDGVEDMADLSYLNEPSVLHNMRLRYNADIIHTYSGLFCVIVNPYKWIQIYTTEMVEIYTGKRRNEVAPHVFAVADGAYRSLLNEKQNQSMLITGESGAGKTENTKKVIQYIANIAGRSGGVGELEQQIIQANPILESFGNAKTNRNNNSSRFGKFIEIQFNDGGLINGASIVSYLLEKSRVVWQAQNERSFHTFYQITKAGSDDEKNRWHITKAADYGFINKSGCYDVRDIDDNEWYTHTKSAMKIMAFSDEDIENVHATVAGVCHLGNIEFNAGRNDSSTVKDSTHTAYASDVLKVDQALLESGLIEPRIKAGGVMVKTALNTVKAGHSRDALAKALYGRLFLWVIKKINETVARARRAAFIGVLDIAGFEIFPYNTFEQLCINYTNEKLQQFFNNHMFKLEQEEYIREKINWTFIDFGMDSQATIDLIEAKAPPGILALLDEACYTNSNDATYLQKCHNQYGKAHPKFGAPRFSKTAFDIIHYAGRVTYETDGWIDKNKDPLQADLQMACCESKNPFVAKLFTDRSLAVAGQSGSAIHAKGQSQRGANFITVGAHHKEGLNGLMKTLYATNPHFIRCILPNSRQEAGHIEDKIVLDQLRCNGVLEGIRIARKGFPNRVIYSDFVKRYYLMAPGIPRNPADVKGASQAILDHIKPRLYSDGPAMKPEIPFRMGLTKVFFRAGTLAWIEEQREKKIGELIIDIQNSCRAWCARKQWRMMREQTIAAKIIQQNLRAWLEFKNWPWWKLYQKARPLLKRRNFEKEVEEREAVIKQLREKIAELENTIKNLEETLKSTNKKLDDTLQKLEAEISKREGLEDELDELEKSKQELQRQIADLTDDLADARSETNDLRESKMEVEKKLRATEENLSAEQKKTAELENIRKDKERELEDAATKAKQAADTIARLEDQKKKLEADVEEVSSASKDVSKAMEAARKKASGELNALQDDLTASRSREEDLQKQKKDLESNIKGLQDQLEAERESLRNQKSETSTTQDQLAAAKRSLDSTSESLEKLKAQHKALQKEREDQEAQLREAYDNSEQLLRSKNKLQDEVDDLTSQLDHESTGRRNAEKQLAAVQQSLREEKGKLAEAQAYGDEQYVQLKRTREELEGVRADFVKEEEKANKLLKEKKAAEAALAAANEEKDELARKNKSLSAKVTELGGALDDAERNAQEAAASSELQNALSKNSAQLAELKALYEVEQGKVKKLEEAKKTLKTEFDELNRSYEDEQNARQAAERMKKKFESELEEMTGKFDAEQKKASKAEAERKRLVSELQIARAQGGGGTLSESDVKKYLDQIQELKDTLESEAEAKNALDKRRRAAEAAFDEQKQALEEALDAKDRANRARRALEVEMEELKDSVEEAEEAQADLEEAKRRVEIETEDIKKKLALEIEARERLEQQKKDLEQELADFRGGNDEAAKAKGELERRARRLEGEIEELNVRLESELKARQKLESANKKLTSDYRTAKGNLANEATARNDQENSVWKLEEELDELRAKFDTAEKARAVLEKANKTFEKQVGELREQLDDEARAKSRLEKQKRSLENELEEVREQIDEAEEAQQEAEDSRRKVELELEDMRRVVERESEQRDQFEETARKAEHELSALRDRLAEEEVGRSAAERAKKKLEQEVEDISKQLDAEQKARAKIEKAKRALEVEAKELRDAKEAISRTARAGEGAAGSAADQVKKLRQQLAEETERAGAAEGARRRFELQNKTLQDDLDKLEEQFAATKTQLDEVTKEKDELNARIRAVLGK
jgi:myosin protein heavy chain